MDIFEEIEYVKKQKQKNNGEVQIQKLQNSENGQQIEQNKLKLRKEGNIFFAPKEILQIDEETKKQLQYINEGIVEHGWERERSPGFWDYWKNQAIAEYMSEAEDCSDKRRKKLREKAIKILKKQIPLTSYIKEAIEEEGFSDFLGIYDYISDIDSDFLDKRFQITSFKPNAERYRHFVKYLSDKAVGTYNIFNKFSLVASIKPEELRELIFVRPNILNEMGKELNTLIKRFNLSQQHIEVVLQTGRMGFSKDYTKELVDYYWADENSYLYKYYQAICDNDKQPQKVEQQQIVKEKVISKNQAEEEIDKIFAEACLAVEDQNQR